MKWLVYKEERLAWICDYLLIYDKKNSYHGWNLAKSINITKCCVHVIIKHQEYFLSASNQECVLSTRTQECILSINTNECI